jgi:uncharacterized membrane protein
MNPYMYGGWLLAVLLMVAAPLLVLGLFALVVAWLNRPAEDTAMRIAKQRFARGEIDKEQLGVLLQAL